MYHLTLSLNHTPQVLPPDISTSFPTRGPGNVYLTAKDLDYLLDEEFIHDQASHDVMDCGWCM